MLKRIIKNESIVHILQVPSDLHPLHPLRRPGSAEHQTHPRRGGGGEKEIQNDKQTIQKEQQVPV